MAQTKYYSYKNIMSIDALYRVIIGQRSNGKTYGWCRLAMDTYLDLGLPSAYVRRLDEMVKPSIVQGLFDPHLEHIKRKTQGKYNAIEYRAGAWTLIRREPDKKGNLITVAKDAAPFCRAYSINTVETTKGVDRGAVWSVCFDEFITRQYYLSNEFIMFQNLLSSIIRDRDGVQIFMLANTVSKYCPYFAEMGLYRISKQEQGTIDVYQLGKSGSQIAVEYCAEAGGSQKVSKYFAFDNPQLDMITSGAWEIALYRHAPQGLGDCPIELSIFVEIQDKIIQGDIVLYDGYPLVFWHPKTTPIKDPDSSIIYVQDHRDANPLHQRDINVVYCRAQELVRQLIKAQKTFYADNETGEAIAAWLRPQRLLAR